MPSLITRDEAPGLRDLSDHADRVMFEQLGLNVERQPNNGVNPRPDNRPEWA